VVVAAALAVRAAPVQTQQQRANITAYLIAHSHQDAGWLKTIDQYYEEARAKGHLSERARENEREKAAAGVGARRRRRRSYSHPLFCCAPAHVHVCAAVLLGGQVRVQHGGRAAGPAR